MAIVQLPGLFSTQPRYLAPLDHSHWLTKNIVFAYSCGRGLNDGAHGMGSSVGDEIYTFGPKGLHYRPADDFSYLWFADNDDYDVLGAITIIAHVYVGGVTVQQGMITKTEGAGGSNTPFGFFTEAGGAMSLNRAHAGGGTPFRVWSSAVTVTVSTDSVLAVTQGADISVAPLFYINGQHGGGVATSLYGGAGTGAPTPNIHPIRIGNRSDLASRCYHSIYDAIVVNRVLDATEIKEISNQIWSIWEAPSDDLFIPDTAPPSTVIPVFANHYRNQGIM